MAELVGRHPAARTLLFWSAWGLLALFLVGRFWNLGEGEFVDWDESLYAWRAKVAVETGEWLDQSDYSYNRFYSGSFPPLLIWKMGAMFWLFGYEEWAARVPSALMGCLALLGLWRVGTLLGGQLAGFLAAFFLGAIFYFTRYSRMAQFDVPCAAWMIATLALYLESLHRPERRLRWVVAAGAALGLGLMTKIALPAGMFFVIVASQGVWLALGTPGADRAANSERILARAKRFFVDDLLMGAAATVLWVPWHAYMTLARGREFWDWYIGYHLLARREGVLDWHSGAWWFYPSAAWDRLPAAVASLGLVSAFAGTVALGRAFWLRWKTRTTSAEVALSPETKAALARGAAWAPAWIWLAGLTALFQSSTTKRETYLLLVYPALALLAGLFFADFLRRASSAKLLFGTLATMLTAEILGRSASRSQSVWMLFQGQAEPAAGATVAGEIFYLLWPIFAAGLAGGAILAALAWGWAKLARAKDWRAPGAGWAFAQAVALILAATSLWRQGVEPMFQLDAKQISVFWQEVRPWLDDRERFPQVAFAGLPAHDGPRFMHYLYGQSEDSRPLPPPARQVARFYALDPKLLAPYRKPGSAVIVEQLLVFQPADLELAEKSLEGLTLVHQNPWFRVYARPLED